MIILGYACVNLSLKETTTSRTIRMDTVIKLEKEKPGNGVKFLKNLTLLNISDLMKILEWNDKNNIRFFRVTSLLFPHMGNNTLQKLYPGEKYYKGDMRFAKNALEAVGKFAKSKNIRLTFHAQPYVQLATPVERVYNNSIFELDQHVRISNYLGVNIPNIIIHVGGIYDDKYKTIETFLSNIKKIPKRIRDHLILENDDWHYGIKDVLPICEKTGIPFCLDFFHNSVHDEKVEIDEKLLDRIIATWNGKGVSPKFHQSEQTPGVRKGTHADYVEELPEVLISYAKKHKNKDFYVTVEAKAKDLALLKLRKNYNTLVKSNMLT